MLTVTSLRDFVGYGNDLIVATRGRGFWVMDDISALRQVNGEVLKADAWLFRPADAINVVPGDDDGTPLQRDEPQAQNPPDGAVCRRDRKSTRLNSSHSQISYAVFCLKKKKEKYRSINEYNNIDMR